MVKFINIKGRLQSLSKPLVMAIVNVTPDSFYAASRCQTEDNIVKSISKALHEGADIIDIGAQSSSPVSTLLTCKEELERIGPTLDIVRREFKDAVVSVDTFYSDVAKMAVEEYGVDLINDISGGEIDKKMFDTVARLNVPYILMHMRGVPQTMQTKTDYNNLFGDMISYFSEKLARLRLAGVNDVIIDPGFGFSKTMEQNYELMANLNYFEILDAPILVGISRKSMIYNLLEISPEESLNGTTALNLFSLLNGADILRVHDVKEAVECVRIISKIKEYIN